MAVFCGWYRQPEAQRDHGAVARALHACGADHALLDSVLAERPYLAGAHFTLADVPVGATLYRFYGMGVEVPHLPAVRAWYARLQAVPGYRARIMAPFDELRGRATF